MSRKKFPSLSEILSSEDMEIMARNNYTPHEIVGEGNTRYAIRATYHPLGMEREGCLKVPKRDIPPDSVCTFINLSRLPWGNPNVHELEVAGKLKHGNIAEIYDAFDVNGRVATFEQFISNAKTLEELVQDEGPLSVPDIIQIFSQVVDAIHYSHHSGYDSGYLHRDIKPSNILVTGCKGFRKAYVTDWQNAGKSSDVISRFFPSRGETAYAHAKLLNAPFEKKQIHCDERTDISSIVGSIYYAATGEKPSQFRIDFDDNGIPFDVDGETIQVFLRNGPETIDAITKTMWDGTAFSNARKLPKSLRRLFRKGFSYDIDIRDTYELKHELERADKSNYWRKKIKKHWKKATFGIAAVAAIVFAGIFGKDIQTIPAKHSPNLFDFLNQKRYSVNSCLIGDIPRYLPSYLIQDLKPYVEELRDTLKTRDIKDMLGKATHAYRCMMMPDRNKELDALFLSCYLSPRREISDLEKRTARFLIPFEFLSEEEGERVDHEPVFEALKATQYFIANDQYGNTISEAYSRYFLTEKEIAEAKHVAARNLLKLGDKVYLRDADVKRILDLSSTIDYFVSEDTKGSFKTYIPGYRDYLSREKRELIDRAIIYSFVLDDNGQMIDTTRFLEPMVGPVFNADTSNYEKHNADTSSPE